VDHARSLARVNRIPEAPLDMDGFGSDGGIDEVIPYSDGFL